MLDKRHIGCMFTITPHAYGSVSLQCGDEVIEMTYSSIYITPVAFNIVVIGEHETVTHRFMALGEQDDWVYSCVIMTNSKETKEEEDNA